MNKKKDVENAQKEQYTRSEKKWSQSITNKSALMDRKNHISDWEGVKVVNIESHRRRHVKEAVWIHKTKAAKNRDDGNYELPHVYDDVIQHH